MTASCSSSQRPDRMTHVRHTARQLRGFICSSDPKIEHKLGKQPVPAEGTWEVWSVAGSDHPGINARNSFCAPRRYKFTGSTSRCSVSLAGGFARSRRKTSHSQPSVYAAATTSLARVNSRIAVSEVGA